MSGLQRFERRWAWWVRMRNAMHWKAYDSTVAKRQHSWALYGLVAYFGALLATLLVCLVVHVNAHAQTVDRIPHQAATHKLQLRREAQRVWGLDAPVATFAAQIHQESRWRADAQSPVGAEGLSQFMPRTATWISTLHPTGPGSLAGAQTMNPTWAIRALVTYDQWLWQRVKADSDCERMAFVLSGYNGGLGWVYKRQQRSTTPGTCMGKACTINPGIHPASQRENELYPRLILMRFEPVYLTWGKGACQ